MHERYEELAIIHGWKTQEDCRVPFDDLPYENKCVMLQLAGEILAKVGEKSK